MDNQEVLCGLVGGSFAAVCVPERKAPAGRFSDAGLPALHRLYGSLQKWPAAMKPCGERLKKRDDQSQDSILGHPARGGCRVRGRDGAGARHLRKAVRSGPSGALHGRAAGAVAQGNAAADSRHAAKHAKRIDYEYERAGTASIFMFTEPLAGWREATVRRSKTKVDWAVEVARLLEGPYRNCENVILGVRQLEYAHDRRVLRSVPNRHMPGSWSGAYQLRHTPKHGSWLNIAENELSSLTRQCVSGRRFNKLDDFASRNRSLVQQTSTPHNAAWTGR